MNVLLSPSRMRRDAGFTLLEVLVVLVLLSIVSGALFEGLAFALRIRQGIIAQMERQNKEVLQAFWIRSVISGTQPVSSPRTSQFTGKRDYISGTSNGTLGGLTGAPGQYVMEFKKENNVLTLLYSDQYGASFSLGEWEGGEGKFIFVDQYRTYDQWPPKALIDKFRQTPETIMVQIDQFGKSRSWVAALAGRRDPKDTVLKLGL